jgi:hypothetical protein
MTAASTTTTTTFNPVLATTLPDPTKHVNYTLGMVLGKDDFDQEFAYLAGRDQWLARDLLGRGTVRGLRVHVEPDPTDGTHGPEVVVDPGIAIAPDGNVLRVKVTQCAYLNAWLNAHATVPVTSPPAGGPEPVPAVPYVVLYVVISYKPTATDTVPIPGEPCRSEDDASAPSRLADDFLIELVTAPPSQVELDAMNDLFGWLDAVQVVATGGSTLDAFLAALRGSVPLSTPNNATTPPTYVPPVVPPYLKKPTSPLLVAAPNVPSFWQAALRVYVTELRANDLAVSPTPAPASWLDPGQTPAGDPPTETKLLLAKLLVPVTTGSPPSVNGKATDVLVHDWTRPYLVPSALLQAALLAAGTQANTIAQSAFQVANAANATANTANATANTASTAATAATTTANAASTAATAATTTANAASTAATGATTTANTANATAQRAMQLETTGYTYVLLAAGTVTPSIAPTVSPTAYGNLVVQTTATAAPPAAPTTDGLVKVTFSGLATPPAGIQYVVKALVQPLAASTVTDPIVTLNSFPPSKPTGTWTGVPNPLQFQLFVRNAGANVNSTNLGTLSLMLEISAYYKA